MDEFFCDEEDCEKHNHKKENLMENIAVVSATYIGDLSVKVYFSDDTVKIVNVGDFIRRHPHPQYNKYLDEKKMKRFSLENGNIVWGKNWDLIFPVSQLYAGFLV